MRGSTIVRLASAGVAACIGGIGLASVAAGPVGADAAQTMPAGNLTTFLQSDPYDSLFPGVPVFSSPFVPAGAYPAAKVTGNCASDAPWLFEPAPSDVPPGTPTLVLNFTSGHAVVYRGSSNDVFGYLPGGLNAVGTAELIDVFDPSAPVYVGTAHLWLGQGANAQGQFYAGETVSFTGTSGDSTISFTGNPGFVGHAHAGGFTSGWGQQNLSCNIVPTGG